MKFLLVGINAKYIHSNPAVYSLAAYAKKQTDADGEPLKKHIEIAEYTINQNPEEILSDIYCRKPDVIAFSCYIWNIRLVEELMEELHQIREDLPIWLGGPEVSFHTREMFTRFPYLTGIMVGEGEKTFAQLLQAYCDDSPLLMEDLEKIAGIATVNGLTKERECMDLNEIPFFYEDLSDFENRIIYYESSRGCPFRCKYCLSSIEKKLRFRNVETVKRELQVFLDAKVPQVKFIDRTFNANHEHAMEIWRYIKENDNNVTNFHFEISADLLREEEIALLQTMRPGLVQLEIGVQSTNAKTIAAINRTTDLTKLGRAVAKLGEKENIHRHLDLIAGLPYEDYESFHQSFNDVYNMHPQQLQLGFLKVLKGADMEKQAQEYGIVYRKQPPYEVLYTKWLDFAEMIRLKRIEEMVELFYNSGQFATTIRFMEQFYKDPFLMYEELAEYYEENGYLATASKRALHYERFLAFAAKKDPQRIEVYRELLTYDCYLRENMKTRPDFCNKQDTYREIIHDFYKTEAKQMKNLMHLEFFRYPVWENCEKKVEVPFKEVQKVIFDYRERNPVTKACCVIISKGENQYGI
ncbi:MAG: B12-binding domain-containing radical SAM protein [Lachnospiraceae bacterium]|nr:B12-binding domain-containing radical SAM protein [Lachnospiraceae bacterium]